MTDNHLWTLEAGDVYCPYCGDSSVSLEFTYEYHLWNCDRCRRQWNWEHDGIDWVWPGEAIAWPGCPHCGTRNIVGAVSQSFDGRFSSWTCRRLRCGKTWTGRYWVRTDSAGVVSRWKIRVPVRDVPFRRTLDNPTT